MRIVMFTKMLQDKGIADLVELGHHLDLEGWDLCVRPGYPIHPANAGTELAGAVRTFEQNGLSIPMVTGAGDLLYPDHPSAEPTLAAMDEADVRLIKLGYFGFDPDTQDYWAEVDKIRRTFEAWQKLAETYRVRICYHTHSHRCMGLNAAMMAHLMRDFDPRYFGAYLDPGHMVVEGEEFAVGLAIMGDHLQMIGLKDVLQTRVAKDGHGSAATHWVEAGQGMVDWTTVFSNLATAGFDGPMSVHCEFEIPPEGAIAAAKREVAYFKRMRDAALATSS